MKKRIIFLVGPTAVGKSAVAVHLAKKLNCEIISCDSMQVYRGMEILTSKPPSRLLEKIPHHLIGEVCPAHDFDVARFRQEAVSRINAVIMKKKTPLLVGGTGLYVTILVDGIFQGVPGNEKVRQRLFAQLREFGGAALHQRLQKTDPRAAEKIHPHDSKRIVRALEVWEVTGKPISQLQAQRKGLRDKYDIKLFCLNMPREYLYRRINERVEKMFRRGVVKEVKKILAGKLSRTMQYAIGIRQIKEYIDGELSLDEAKDAIKRATRQYAKRQLTWFRKDKTIQWLELEGKETPARTAARVMALLR